MRILIIKTSSMGDLIHALPALTDVVQHYPDVKFDWVVEQAFAEIPSWHPNVSKVIPISWRKWRKKLLNKSTQTELKNFLKNLRETNYDLIIDMQGLFKSAALAKLAKGKSYGFDFSSAREPLASILYSKKYTVAKNQHAILRLRQLAAKIFEYTFNVDQVDYGISESDAVKKQQVIFIHGTSRSEKEWAEENWIELARLLSKNNLEVLLPWGSEKERLRAERIAIETTAKVLPRMSLSQLKTLLAESQAVVAVDTGLGHLAAALNIPCISIYPATDPARIGAIGQNQSYCLPDGNGKISVNDVYEKLLKTGC